MTPTLTAQELHGIVERLPKKWWPSRVHYHGPDDGFSTCPTDPDPECGIDDAHAYLIFVGHLLQELIGEGFHRFEWDSGETDAIDPSLSLCNHHDPFFGKSILEHLVAAAVQAAKGADHAA